MKTIIQPSQYFKSVLFATGITATIFTGCKKIEVQKPATSNIQNASSLDSRLSNRPNIIFIVGDDIGYEVPTCDGGQSYATPTLDRMARNGMRFTQCHSTPTCSPSRFMLLTGKYNFRNYKVWGHMDSDETTIANMLSLAGYTTCYAGKWQLDGGDASIKAFGWQDYSVWLPFDVGSEENEGSRYKSAKIYEHGAYLDTSLTSGKYSDDMFTSFLIHFMDSAKDLNKPFFAYYSMILPHGFCSPTPDDPEYATWDFADFQTDKKFFPSMIHYMDKKIKEIINHLAKKGMLQNTIIFYVGDNGTEPNIQSLFNGFLVTGGKKETTEPGTNVPLIVDWPGKITPGVSNAFVDFTDFLPTLADLGKIYPNPVDNDTTLDGKSFYPVLISDTGKTKRNNIYDAYSQYPTKSPFVRWVQNDSCKLYDTSATSPYYRFVRITKGKPDPAAVPFMDLTPEDKIARTALIQTLRHYH